MRAIIRTGHKLYSHAIAHICHLADLPYLAEDITEAHAGETPDREKIDRAIHATMTHAEVSHRFDSVAQLRRTGGRIIYLKITHAISGLLLGYVVAWIDADGYSIQYETIRPY